MDTKRQYSVNSVLESIVSHVEHMTAAERAIAQYIISNESEVIYLTARELAERVGVSDASVIRFCQSIGYSGFKELKLKIAMAAQATEPHARPDHAAMPVQSKLGQVFDRAVMSIRNTQRTIAEQQIVEAAERVQNAERICLLGAGTSGIVARDLQIKLNRLGIVALYDDQPQNAAILVGLTRERDVVIAFSHSGNTMETVNLFRVAKEHGAYAIAVTNNAASRLADLADLILLTASDELPFHSFAMTSRIAQLVVVDCLVTILIAMRAGDVRRNLERIARAVTELSHRDPEA